MTIRIPYGFQQLQFSHVHSFILIISKTVTLKQKMCWTRNEGVSLFFYGGSKRLIIKLTEQNMHQMSSETRVFTWLLQQWWEVPAIWRNHSGSVRSSQLFSRESESYFMLNRRGMMVLTVGTTGQNFKWYGLIIKRLAGLYRQICQ